MTHPFNRYAGYTDLAALNEASTRPLRKALRVNTLKSSVKNFTEWAAVQGWQLERVPWCAEGFFINRENKEKALGKDLLHLLGHTYMQEASSMLPVELLDPKPGEMVLDMSAAPGSKSTQIAAKMQQQGVLVANDMQEKRLWTLNTALHRSGVLNVIVTKKVGQWFAKHMTERFDRVLCDAPCTAQGTSRKDLTALNYSSEASIRKAAKLQFELLEAAVHACKTGGRIVYSTCTLTPEENENIVQAILNKFSTQLQCIDPRETAANRAEHLFDTAIGDSEKVQGGGGELPLLRIWPQTYDTEGFFCAVLQKTRPTKEMSHLEARPLRESPVKESEQREIEKFLEYRYGTSMIDDGEKLFVFNNQFHIMTGAASAFFLPVTPFAIGMPFGKRLTESPVYISHEMATSRGNKAVSNVAALDDARFDQYMKGEDCDCDPSLLGHVVVHYKHLCIGRGRAKEGRLKNHIPRSIIRINN